MNTETTNDTLRITGITELTAGTAREVKDLAKLHFGSDLKHIDFDASELAFLDSSGLGALISMQKTASERGGKFRLLSPTPAALQVIELTRLHRVFEIVS
jgi:anti-sigma B factor antagonist